ncbi:hypothetical protein [Clostridium ganghwense]|uniref:GNAT family N-acetyltransferase n=1 Tax=Clostridium ganghwense TaxID=312089 RepID=A0ABT4CNC7_9CLOT|nr:hypothetical protein [Clostridium ganghwense]MCY6370542.1 hypothetical protein [Clostridium ganghwense]
MSYVDEIGYLNNNYANSFKEWGEPITLGESRGWLLKRKIAGYNLYDAMGLYPLFCCKDWKKLSLDFQKLKNNLVSITLVTDPFGEYKITELYKIFDFVKPFKKHYIVDLSCELNKFIYKGHKRKAKKALKDIEVEICTKNCVRYLDEFIELYNVLIKRHKITGIRRFSRKAFEYQLKTPGTILIRGVYDGRVVGMKLCIIHEDVAYDHLMAISHEGYNMHASYGITLRELEYLKNKVKWIDLGANAGINSNLNDGLNQFKRGWSTGKKMVYLCGKVLDEEKYDGITWRLKKSSVEYFPEYREGEF